MDGGWTTREQWTNNEETSSALTTYGLINGDEAGERTGGRWALDGRRGGYHEPQQALHASVR